MEKKYKLKFKVSGMNDFDTIEPMSALPYGFRNISGTIHLEWSKDFVENNPDYFELVTEPSIVPERIEVSRIGIHDNFMGNKSDSFWYQFCTSKPLNIALFPPIQRTIENVLNDTVVEDKRYHELFDENKMLLQKIKQMQKQSQSFSPFTQPRSAVHKESSPVSAFIDYREKIEALYEKPDKAALPLQQVQEGKPNGKEIKCAIEVGMQIMYTTNNNWDKLGRKPHVTAYSIPEDKVLLSDGQTISIGGFLDNIESGRYKLLGNVYGSLPTPNTDTISSKPVIDEGAFKNSCNVCGDNLVYIRGKFPNTDKRLTCPTCTTERLDQISEISHKDYGKTYQSN